MWWREQTPAVRFWVAASVVGTAVIVVAMVAAGGGDRGDKPAGARDAYNACVDLAKDALIFATSVQPEPFAAADVDESGGHLIVTVDIDAPLPGGDASGQWRCEVDDGEVVGVDAPEI